MEYLQIEMKEYSGIHTREAKLSCQGSDLQASTAGAHVGQYLAALDTRLAGVTSSNDSAPLRSYLEASAGAFPTLVIERLGHLGRRWSVTTRETHLEDHSRPELHPLDYEWLFTPETVMSLCEWIGSRSANLIGLPSVARALAGNFTLVERNPFVMLRDPHVVQRGTVVLADVRDLKAETIPPQQVVLFDSPWYLGETLLWLSRAAEMVEEGGMIGFILFPELSRPESLIERELVLAYAETVGEVEIATNAVGYQTPRFEWEALRAASVPGISRWRRGDLVTIRVGLLRHKPLPLFAHPLERDAWNSFRIDGQVIKLRSNPVNVHGEPHEALAPVLSVGSWRLASVSERDPTRRVIDLWTSRNRVAMTGQPARARAVLTRVADAPNPRSALRGGAWIGREAEAEMWLEFLDLSEE